ncbi:MAG TPA: HAMP domain-containing sensor histidine kinase [Solirubrobacterales bacterium]|nr:HAMP domain-containing sensor histidine kinase [Solirubrobacterales bacterium]
MPRGIRLRLVLAISAVSVATVAASFFALHETTAANLRSRIDRELNEQYAEFQQRVLNGGRVSDPASLRAASDRFVAGQRYHPEARIYLIAPQGLPPVTNQTRIVDEELAERRSGNESGEADAGGIVSAGDGLTTISTDETGKLRVLTQPVVVDGDRIGTFRVADPLTSVDQALQSLRNRFIAVGFGALLLSVAIAIWLANLITRPLRRMAAVASAVDSGDLSHRIDYGGDDEVGVLADSFNHMMDRLEEGFRLQREFVSDASHELRSPLTVLRGRIEQLADNSGDRAAVEAEADELMKEVRRMERLTDDMLTLAKAERGGLVQPRRVPIDDFVEDLRRDLPLLGSRHYHVESTLHGELEADPDRLAQVLRNLVTNAVRHTGSDGHIDVSIGSQNGAAIFAVADDGTGIEPTQLDRIFDRFHRTDEGRSRAEGGSGLGLAIARAIVEAHGGTISASSTPGQGATIRFRIPGYRPG